jgi:hypothetical protein
MRRGGIYEKKKLENKDKLGHVWPTGRLITTVLEEIKQNLKRQKKGKEEAKIALKLTS